MRSLGTAVIALAVSAGCSFDAGSASDAAGPRDGSPGGTEAAIAIDSPIDSPPLIDADIPPGWLLPAFDRRSTITIDNSQVTAELDTFPVLVTLTGSNFDYSHAEPNGADLRFVGSASSALLPYEIDTWVTGGTSLVWVGVTIGSAATGAQPPVTMYYGSPNAAAGANGSNVFGEYTTASHMTDLSDSTGQGHVGAAVNGETAPTPTAGGRVGGAQNFDSGSDALTLPTPPIYAFTGQMTVSLWVKMPAFNTSFQCIVCKGDHAWRIQRDSNNRGVDFATNHGGANSPLDMTGGTNLDDNSWHYIAAVVNNTEKALIIDGTRKNQATPQSIDDFPADSAALGANLSTSVTPRNFQGIMDEVRITAIGRPEAWLFAEYRTVTDPTFAVVQTFESLPGT